MIPLKISRVGNSAALILTKEALAQLNVQPGEVLYMTQAPDGARLTKYDPTFETQMKTAEGVMHEYRDVLRELAK